MKKYLSIFLVVLFVFTLCACNHENLCVDNSSQIEENTSLVDSQKTANDLVENINDSIKTSSEQSYSKEQNTSKTSDSNNSSKAHTHIYGDWKTLIHPDCRFTGEKQRSCDCGATEIVKLPAVDHRYNDKGVCGVCGYKNEIAFISDTPTAQFNTIGAERGDCNVAAQGNWLYFANGKKIIKAKNDGSVSNTIYTIDSGRTCNINIVGDWIYFCVENTAKTNSYIAKVRTDGFGFEKLLNSVIVRNLLVIKDSIYFTSYTNPYKNFAEDICPLYVMSINGGMSHQINDGYVSNLTADSKYVYFSHAPQYENSSIYRMKHNGQSKETLLTKKDFNNMVLQNSRLYFMTPDNVSGECIISSVSINGGSVTTHGRTPAYSEWLAVIGQKFYYNGIPYSDSELLDMYVGVIEFDLTSNKYRLIREDFEMKYAFALKNQLFVVNGENSYLVYNTNTQKWNDIILK